MKRTWAISTPWTVVFSLQQMRSDISVLRRTACGNGKPRNHGCQSNLEPINVGEGDAMNTYRSMQVTVLPLPMGDGIWMLVVSMAGSVDMIYMCSHPVGRDWRRRGCLLVGLYLMSSHANKWACQGRPEEYKEDGARPHRD